MKSLVRVIKGFLFCFFKFSILYLEEHSKLLSITGNGGTDVEKSISINSERQNGREHQLQVYSNSPGFVNLEWSSLSGKPGESPASITPRGF